MDRLAVYGSVVLRSIKTFRPADILHLRSLVVILWIWVIYRGERSAFDNAISRCSWPGWEPWAAGANPYHLVLLADPQLVDPHTYPGRPWPLSSLTVYYTDLYLKRSYNRIQSVLDPDTVYFLGDLFDGGREWRTGAQGFQTADKRWRRYRHDFWKKEYRRFADIFLRQKDDPSQQKRHRNMVLSLPGNHDIGFGTGVQSVVRNRFQTFFGESNRVDIFGNHTFIGIDTVSLSALTGRTVAEPIWKPTVDFLDHVQSTIERKTAVALDLDLGLPKFGHALTDQFNTKKEDALLDTPKSMHTSPNIPQLPIVAMTHVPLYRDPGTPCGPLRERYPPSAPGLATDERNAIRVAGGYQYQNVLTKQVTKLVTDQLGRVRHAFSGDDHDYCELTHKAFASAGAGIKEVTVKSMSWAMGVRKPGFLLVSLWNPIDESGEPTAENPQQSHQPTLSSQLCLLPDQLSIFMGYVWYLSLSSLALAIHAFVAARNETVRKRDDAILPLSTASMHTTNAYRTHDDSSLIKALGRDGKQGSGNVRARTNSVTSQCSNHRRSPGNSPPVGPMMWQAAQNLLKRTEPNSVVVVDDDDAKGFGRRDKRLGLRQACLDRLIWDMGVVVALVGPYYLWLLSRG